MAFSFLTGVFNERLMSSARQTVVRGPSFKGFG